MNRKIKINAKYKDFIKLNNKYYNILRFLYENQHKNLQSRHFIHSGYYHNIIYKFRLNNLIKSNRKGQFVYYSITKDGIELYFELKGLIERLK